MQLTVVSQLDQGHGRKVQRAVGTARLHLDQPESALDALELVDHVDGSRTEVDRIPLEAPDLALTEAQSQRHGIEGSEPLLPGGGQQLPDLIRVRCVRFERVSDRGN